MRAFFRAAVAALLLAAARGAAAPRLVVEPPGYDFGSVANDGVIQHDFIVRNAGDQDLVIFRAVSSCAACLQATLEKARLAPGERAVLHARLDVRRLDGPVSRAILLSCNDPANDSPLVALTALVIPSYAVTPPEIDLDLSEGPRAAEIEIVPLHPLHAPLSRVQGGDPSVAVQLVPRGAGRFVLTVRALDSLPRGNHAVDLTLSSADARDPSCRVTGVIHHPPDLELIPERLQLVAQAEPQTRILWVRQHGASPLILLDAIAPAGNFHCEIDPAPDGRDYRIYLTAWEQHPDATQANALILKMRDQNQKERLVSVPLTVEAAGGPGPR